MNNPPKVQKGDLVEVVLRGEVLTVWNGTKIFDIGIRGGEANSVSPSANHVISIMRLPKPIKVGDILTEETSRGLVEIRGALVASADKTRWFIADGNSEWVEDDGDRYPESLMDGRIVMFIPGTVPSTE